MKLTTIDYKILKFVSKNQNCRKQDILKKFKADNSIEYRLKKLTENKFDIHCNLIENSSYINHKCQRTYIDCGFYDEIYSDCYFLNPIGYKALSDYESSSYKQTIKNTMIYLVLPVLVAVVSYFIIELFKNK